MNQVLRNTASQQEIAFFGDEEPIDADGDVTVTVTDSRGGAVESGSAVPTGETGRYRYTLAPSPEVVRLALAWSGVFAGVPQAISTYVEVVGGLYVGEAELRGGLNLGDNQRFTTADFARAREWFETTLERHCGMSFVPRWGLSTLDGDGSAQLLVEQRELRGLLSATVDGATVTAGELDDWRVYSYGLVVRPSGSFPAGRRNVVLTVEHGLDEPPEDVRTAAFRAIRFRLLEASTGEDRSYALSTSEGIVRLSTPGTNRPFGIPFVDEVANGYRRRRLTVT